MTGPGGTRLLDALDALDALVVRLSAPSRP
jgi:hypothetical protein